MGHPTISLCGWDQRMQVAGLVAVTKVARDLMSVMLLLDLLNYCTGHIDESPSIPVLEVSSLVSNSVCSEFHRQSPYP